MSELAGVIDGTNHGRYGLVLDRIRHKTTPQSHSNLSCRRARQSCEPDLFSPPGVARALLTGGR